MCGRYNLVTNAEALIDAFEIIHQGDTHGFEFPHYNISPSDSTHIKMAPVVLMQDRRRSLQYFCWPFLPAFAHATVGKYCVANAMLEKLENSKVYGHAWTAGQRCLVPATGFYEWQVQAGQTHKQPYLIELSDQALFGMAGVWGMSSSRDGSIQIMSFAIITLPANPLMAEIHNDKQRMPAILRPNQYGAWLSKDNKKALACLLPYPEKKMRAVKVSTYLNNPQHNDTKCIARLN